jgi:glyoxylase-like metal-dependent hydrolase (beta-lactamase superfamily II)
MISGDQVLPRITPNVSIFPNEPNGDSLKEWLHGLERLRQILPDNLLVLPSHQEPFYGVRTRLTQIIESHDEGLDKLYQALIEPKRVIDCFPALFKNPISNSTLNLAAGETLAHLNCLIGRKMATFEEDQRGVYWYRQVPEARQFD